MRGRKGRPGIHSQVQEARGTEQREEEEEEPTSEQRVQRPTLRNKMTLNCIRCLGDSSRHNLYNNSMHRHQHKQEMQLLHQPRTSHHLEQHLHHQDSLTQHQRLLDERRPLHLLTEQINMVVQLHSNL